MRVDVIMPQLGESVVEGTITRWLVLPGDLVQRDQAVVEVATDKADSEVPAPQAGRIERLLAAEGSTVKIGAALCVIETEATAAQVPTPVATSRGDAVPAPSGERAKAPPRGTFGACVTSPAVRRLALEHAIDPRALRGSGAHGRVTRDDVLRAAGLDPDAVTRAPAPQGDPGPGPMPPPAPAPEQSHRAGEAVEIAALLNPGVAVPIPGVGYNAYKVPAYMPKDGDQIVAFSRRRRLIADHMVYSKAVSPHVVTVAEIDLERTVRLREQHKAVHQSEGIALTLVTFVCAAVVKALREHPGLNARVLDDRYVLLGEVNLGVAVDTPEGLLVPVIRRADELSLRGLARAIAELAARAREGKLTADELSGSSFTVSNPGAKGNLFGAAVISQPNVGILRTGEVKKRVVVIEGEGGADAMAIHPVMYAALSYDHRIIDGVMANAFLWRVGEILRSGQFAV